MGPVSRLQFEGDGVENVPLANGTGTSTADILDREGAKNYAHRASADVATVSRRTNLVAQQKS
jgi:hypothetical protein